NAITKSGSNDVRGEAFYQIRHKELGLNNPIFNVLPNETLQQFGGSAGGPLARDRWFWFAGIEQQYSRIPRQVQFNNLPAAAPAGAQEAFNFFRNEEQGFRQTNDATALTARTDYTFRPGHQLTLRYNHSTNTANNAASAGGALSPLSNDALSNNGTEKNSTHTGTLQYTHLFSPTVINDLRFATTMELRPRESNSVTPTVAAGSSGLLGQFGARSFLPTTQDDTRMQIVEGLSMAAGDHTLKLGVDYSRLKTFQAFGFNQFGAFNIAGSNVATILDILSVGGTLPNRFGSPDVTYSRQLGNLLADFGVHQLAFYAQDSWRVRPNLTFDLGFRWEGQWNPDPDTTNTALVNTVASTIYPVSGGRLDPTRIPDSLDQIMPRAGFAWNPFASRRTAVVRGHAGLFYGPTPMIVFAGHTNNFRTPPGNVSITMTNQRNAQGQNLTVYDQLLAVGVDLNSTPLTALPVIPLETVQRATAIGAAFAGQTVRDPFTGVGLDIVAPDFRNPRAFQAGLGYEGEIVNGLVGGIQLNYVNTVNLLRNRDWNLPAPIIRPDDPSQRPFYGLRSGRQRPAATLGPYTVRESSARSLYRGATAQLQYRTTRMQFGAFYTISETFSDSDLERDAGGVDFENAFDFSRDYNYSRLDARHQFSLNAVVTLPLDFEVSGIVRARSGYPLNALTGADTNEDLFTTDRPYSAPGVPFERHSFRNRGTSSTDLRVMKNFRFGEVRRLQFSAEFFNLFNQENVVFNSFTGTGAAVTYGPGLGAPIDPRFMSLRNAAGGYNAATTTQHSTNPLQVQLGLRLFF
ncbi:MAG TPA: TonB-dependent receptor, partial [Bryobacteraceae bacterium]|nr:TonB-dependent receptor [Bryobacteraceae bacterium]